MRFLILCLFLAPPLAGAALAQSVPVDTLAGLDPRPEHGFGVDLASVVDAAGIPWLLVTDRGAGEEGAIYVHAYHAVEDAWVIAQTLSNEAPDRGLVYRSAVTLDAEGQPLIAVSDAGWVTMWRRMGEGWMPDTSFQGINKPGIENPAFGSGISVTALPSGEEVVFVGAEDGGDTDPSETGNREGSAYAFVRAPGSPEWVREARLLAPDARPGDEFGAAVAVAPLSGGHPGDALALVGAPDRPFFPGNREGRALAFRRDGATGTWAFETELYYPDGDPDVGEFGAAVALLPVPGGGPGEVLAFVGAPFANACGATNAGITYAFLRTPDGSGSATWTLEDRLCPGTPRSDSRSGSAIALDAHPVVPLNGPGVVRALVGTEPGPIPSEGHPGAADLFERTAEGDVVTWTRRATFASGAAGSQEADWYGSAVALAGDFALVGAPVSNAAAPAAGAVFVYGPDSMTTAVEVPAPHEGVALSVRPNPVRGRAEVAVSLDRRQSVQVVLLDVLGRAVAVLHEGPLGAGAHTLGLDASALAPGLYLVAARAEAGRVVRTLTVVR